MMKLLRLCIGSATTWCNSSGVTRVFLHCTRTLTSSPAPTNDTLYSRILPIIEQKVSITPILDQWIHEGRDLDLGDLRKMIKQLRKYKRSRHALQISEWISDKLYLDLSPSDVAVQLDLISKVHGLEHAEKYFDNIPNNLKVFQVYGALLNCYADAKSLAKAEAIMQKMRELGYSRTLSYNVMLKLYLEMGKHMQMESLVQEIEEKDITQDEYTINIRLNAYAAVSDITGMEKLLAEMEANPVLSVEWNAYVTASNGYLKVGAIEKALAMLKKSEQLIKVQQRKFAYEVLLTLYASTGKREEVYRIWNTYKKIGKVFNGSYLCMISSLAKLDDLDGAEEILEEWETKHTNFDFRLPNFLISAYCKKGLLGKAESIVNRLIDSGKEPNASTWSRMALGYHKDNQMEKAVETLRKAILASYPGWRPNLHTLASCVEYLKGKGDVETAQEIIRLLEEKCNFSTDIDSLVKYIENGNAGTKALEHTGEVDRTLQGEMLGGIGSNQLSIC